MGDDGQRKYSANMLDSSATIKKLAGQLQTLVNDFRSANKRAVAALEGDYITQYNAGLKHLQDTMDAMGQILHGGGQMVSDFHGDIASLDGNIASSMPT